MSDLSKPPAGLTADQLRLWHSGWRPNSRSGNPNGWWLAPGSKMNGQAIAEAEALGKLAPAKER